MSSTDTSSTSTTHHHHHHTPNIYSVEGNIGSGKSTFIKMLKEYYETHKDNADMNLPQMIFVDEPVSEWVKIQDEDGKNILEHFYEDQTKYAFQFQMMAYITRLKYIQDAVNSAPKDAIIITERCNFTDRNVFAKMLYEEGKIDTIQYTIYNKWFEQFVSTIPISGLVYIHTNPYVAHERVVKRSRKGESIPLEYLARCSRYHDQWLDSEKTSILKLDANEDKHSVDDYTQWFSQLVDFVRNDKQQ